jgi:predicted alpha/beta-fold hydrolase
MKLITSHIKKKFPKAKIYGFAFSIGANVMAKFAAETKENCPFSGIYCVSNVFDLQITSNYFQSFPNFFLYSKKIAAFVLSNYL